MSRKPEVLLYYLKTISDLIERCPPQSLSDALASLELIDVIARNAVVEAETVSPVSS